MKNVKEKVAKAAVEKKNILAWLPIWVAIAVTIGICY